MNAFGEVLHGEVLETIVLPFQGEEGCLRDGV
jgi:hypothetical protein